MELKCPSLDYVNSMTWAEFQIRAYGYNREQDLISYRFRKVGFAAMWSFHSNPKKLPKTEDKYWQIGTKDITTNESMQDAILKARDDYFKQLKEKNKSNPQ